MKKVLNINELLKDVDWLRQGGFQLQVDPAVTHVGAHPVDGLLTIGSREGRATFGIDWKPALGRSDLGNVIETARQRSGLLLIARHIPPADASILRENEVPFLDGSGNAWIKTPHFLVLVEGRKALRTTSAENASSPSVSSPRLFTPAGLQVVFALLTDPQLIQKTTRDLAAITRLSNGTVAAVLRELDEQAYSFRPRRKAPRRLRDTRALMDKWTEAYLQRLQPKLLYGYYRSIEPPGSWVKSLDTELLQVKIGGEPAAAELDGYLVPELFTFYGPMHPHKLIQAQKLERDPGGGNIVLRKKFWFHDIPDWNKRLVPALLIYADLLGTGDARCIDAAGRIRDRHLLRLLDD